MEKVKEFLEFLLKNEQEAIFLEYFRDKIEEYNEFIEENLNSYCEQPYDKSLGEFIPFKIRGKICSPASDRFYKVKENATYPIARYLFKISQYEHDRYGHIWICYVSNTNPSKIIKSLTDCFLVAEIEGDLKIIAKMGIDPNVNKWTFYGGDEDKSLRLHNLGTPVKIERYVEPLDDETGLKEYLKNS